MDPLISLHIGMSHEAITKAWTQYLKTLTTVSHTTNFHNVMNIDDGLWRFLPSCHLFIFEYLNEAGASRHILVQHIPSLAVQDAFLVKQITPLYHAPALRRHGSAISSN
jgi:hypothetical protein